MSRQYTKPPRFSTAARQFPERLTVIRAASVSPRGVTLSAAAFVSDGRACWRPGMNVEDARPVNALDALRRNAEEAARHGIFAPERRKAAA